jgi:hypothetical protein
MTNPLQALVVDSWYKAIIVVSVVFLLVAITVDLKGVENRTVMLLSFGAFFVGIGEWINHPLQVRVIPGAKITSHNRLPGLLGSLFDVLGFLLVCLGVYPLFK